MKISSIATALFLSIKTSEAFVAQGGRAPFLSNSNSGVITSLSSTSESTSASATSSASSEEKPQIAPEFEAALKQVTTALSASLDNPALKDPLVHFCDEYFTACSQANADGADISAMEAAERMKNAIEFGMKHGLQDKYKFGVTHTALRGQDPELEDGNTIDFYKFGCDFFRPAMNLNTSVILGTDALEKVKQQLADGENVVFFANHQSEADPQVMSVLMEKAGAMKEAEEMTYVAGHKVTTDTLAIPFSMGRNLICIHSKKHIDADPETKPLKSRQNLAAMNGMLKKMKKGGSLIWVAPSGGRDRRDLETGKVPLAPFDQKTIDMFRLMGNKSKQPMHYYAVSMVSYDLCPPPDFVEAGTGEQRNVRYVPVGIKISDELENVGGLESRHLFTDHAFELCEEGYNELLEAMGMEDMKV